MNRILIIDDDRELCALMKKCVEQEHLSAVTANCGEKGLRLFDEKQNSSILLFVILGHLSAVCKIAAPEGAAFVLAKAKTAAIFLL